MTIIKQDNFDTDTVGAIAPGFVNVGSAVWVVGTTNPISGARSFGPTTTNDGDVTIDTSVAATENCGLQFDQNIVAFASPAIASTGAIVRADSAAWNSGYLALIVSVASNGLSGTAQFFKRTAGSFAGVGSAQPFTVTTAIAVGAVLHSRLTAIDSGSNVVLSAFYSVGSDALPTSPSSIVTDSSSPITTPGYPGFYKGVGGLSGTPAQAVDNYQFDNGVASSPVVVNATNAAILYSPGNWAAVGSTMKTINAGAYFSTRFSGASCTLAFDMTNVSTPVPNLAIIVDGQAVQYAALASTIAVTVPTALSASPKHHLEVIVRSTTETQNRWNAPQNTGVVFQSLTLASGGAADLPQRRYLKGLIFGDSITEGVRTLNATAANDTDRNDSTVAWSLRQRDQLGAEIGVIGFGATGLSVSGSGNVPAFPSTYNFLWSGQARTFDSDLNFIVINEGTNDSTTNITSAYTTVLNGLLAAIPAGCKIFCMRPLNGTLQQSNIQAAIAACTTPARVSFVDTNGWIVNASDTSDNVHPLAPADLASVAPRLGNVVLPALIGAGASGTFPTAAQVLTGVTFGPTANLTGNFIAPTAAQVQSGVTFGSAGSLTGTYASGTVAITQAIRLGSVAALSNGQTVPLI